MGSSRVSSWNPEETPAAPFGKLHGSFHSAAEITDATFMEPAWHLRGTLTQPSWNLHVNQHGNLHEPAWEPSLNHHGNFYGALMGIIMGIIMSTCCRRRTFMGLSREPSNLHCTSFQTSWQPSRHLHGDPGGTFMATVVMSR